MYIVLQSGSKQHLVRENQIIRLEKLDISVGKTFELTKILMIVNDKEAKIGTPFIRGVVVNAEVVAHGRDKKIKVVKFRRRKHYRKQYGHRQWFTDIKVINISTIT